MKKKITLALSMLCVLALVIALASCDSGHEHTADSSWKNDDTSHWNECVTEGSSCGEKLNSAAHTFEKETIEATCTETGLIIETCTVCGFEKTTDIEIASHDYAEATCELPKTCKGCGVIEGEALGHKGGTATCQAQAVCEVCNESYGTWGDHVGGKATCRSKAICSECRTPYGELGGHEFADATCLEPKTCTLCSETMGEPAGHSGGEATCTELAKCASCGEAYGELAKHKGGEATCTEKAVCEVCNEPYGAPNGHKVGNAICTDGATCEVCGEPYGIHTSENGVCTSCGVTLTILGADAIESAVPSHEGGGSANVDKLFDGDKTTTGIWGTQDKEYFPVAVGDSLVITLKEETNLIEAIIWTCGNWTNAKIEFLDENGNVVLSKNVNYNGGAYGGDSVPVSIVLGGKNVKSIKLTCSDIKGNNDGRTQKTSELELVVNTPVAE